MTSGVSIHTPVSIPMPVLIQRVGCIILTKRGLFYDFVLAHSYERNAFEVFGGSIQYGTDPLYCMNYLLQNMGMRVSSQTPYIDMINPVDGKLNRVYVLYVNYISCKALTQLIQINHVISSVFHYFTRFPVQNVIRSPHNLIDDKGFPRIVTTFTQNILERISPNYLRYL